VKTPDFLFPPIGGILSWFESYDQKDANKPMGNIRLRFLLVGVLLIFSAGIVVAESVQLHIDVGLNHFYKKRYLEAFKEFKAAVEVDPKNSEAHFSLGRVYKVQGFFKEAVLEFEVALALNPSYLQARRELDQIKSSLESDVGTKLKIQGQEEATRQRDQDFPGSTPEQRAQEFLRKGQTSQAIASYEEAAKADPFNGRIRKALGFLYFNRGDLSAALKNYEDAGKLSPNDAEIVYAIGLTRMRSRDFEQAVVSFSRAAALSPDLLKAQFALGEAYEALGRFEDSAFQYKKVIAINPQSKEANNRLRELSGRMGYNYFSRGGYYYQQGDYDKAEALLSLAKQFGGLPEGQNRQIEEMLGAARYWIRKKQEATRVSDQRKEIRQQSYINKNVTVADVVGNPAPYIGNSVEWEGWAVFSDEAKGRTRYFVNTNNKVNTNSNLDFTFGILFPKDLPNDPRVSVYSQIQVKGKIVGMEKAFNNWSQTQSSRRQPIVEATEVTFTRDNYEQPLTLRYY